jgi:hypothetical protein
MLKSTGALVQRNSIRTAAVALVLVALAFSVPLAFAQNVTVPQGFTATTRATEVFQPIGVDLDSAGNLYAGTGGFTNNLARWHPLAAPFATPTR